MKSVSFFLAASMLAGGAIPAWAGDTVVYRAADAWVSPREIDTADENGPMVVLFDQQVRMADGVVSTFQDRAIRLSTPAALTQFGTVTARWLPDKGDLIVHRIELIRDGMPIDLLAGGAKFDVLRREEQLEQRIVDGSRTASLVVPGARLGDILRIAYTITVDDQAIGPAMESISPLPSKPIPLQAGGLTVSWPADEEVRWKAFHGPDDLAVEERDGARFVSVQLPLDKRPEMPGSAPFRYNFPPIFQAGTFDDWAEVSGTMADVFAPKATFASGGPLAQQVSDIEGMASDPLERAALATQLVQDKIGYLANGMDGGNYIPQAPDETWAKRFGDCKAKTVLLLSLLHAMDIEAEPLLVRSAAGDVLPELLPMAGDFDHVIVHATIGGKDYWLDGTDTGTRLANIATVPAFFYGLPLREGGAGLLQLEPRLPEAPTHAMTITLDSRAGVSVPSLYRIDMAVGGAAASGLRAAPGQLEGAALRDAVLSMVSTVLGDSQATDTSISYDETSGLAHVRAEGILTTPWQREEEVFAFTPPSGPAANVGFDTDRARAAWADIPLRLNGPLYHDYTLELLLPDGGEGYTMEGEQEIGTDIAGVAISSDARLADGSFTLRQTVRGAADEMAAADIPAAARANAAMARDLPKVEAPEETRMVWQYTGADRELLAPIQAAYARLIENAQPDEMADDYLNRANFRAGVGDLAGAEDDLDRAIDEAASVDLYYRRGFIRRQRGDWADALADFRMGESLENKGNSYDTQVDLLGLLGRGDEALSIAEEYAAIAEEPSDAKITRSSAMMWAGEKVDGQAMLRAALKRRPGDPQLLNALCWQAGIWDMVDDATIESCDGAVTKSDWSANVLDSRALAYFRQGKLQAARDDLDAALASDPWQAQSRYLRGVVRIAMGERDGGRQDIADALALYPGLAKEYAVWGVAPGS